MKLLKPFVQVNCAMSADGKSAGPDRKQVRISSEEDKARVKELRRRSDAILVGIGTVLADDPKLTIKGASYDENPIRVVLDAHGRTPDDAKVLDGNAPTVIVTDAACEKEWRDRAIVMRCGKDGRIDLPIMLHLLAEHLGVESVMVEGGGEVIASFFRDKLVDRYTVFVGGLIIGGRDAPTPADGDGWVAEGGVKLELQSAEVLGNGALLTFMPRY
jgi:2,5-diamino-6-(ribosylamino)-4(3H)-pyrimidinone 5'-phosphate reductase